MKLTVIGINGVKCKAEMELDDLLKLTEVDAYLEFWPDYTDIEWLRSEAEFWDYMCRAHGCEPAFDLCDLLEDEMLTMESLARISVIPYDYYEQLQDILLEEYRRAI